MQRASPTHTRWDSRPQTLYGIADSPVGLAAYLLDHDALQLRAHRARLRRAARRPYARRRPRQHHALLVDEHGDFFGAVSIGRTSYAFFSAQGVSIPVAVSVFPDELYPGAAELGRAGVSQTHPLQQARQGRPLRGLGTAGTLYCRDPRGIQIAALALRDLACPIKTGRPCPILRRQMSEVISRSFRIHARLIHGRDSSHGNKVTFRKNSVALA